jgi:hypothetical protein
VLLEQRLAFRRLKTFEFLLPLHKFERGRSC